MDDAKKILIYLTVVVGVLLAGYVIFALAGVLTPFLLAFLLAYLFNPLVNKLQTLHIRNKFLPRLVGVMAVFLILILIFVILVVWLIPVLVNQLSLLVTTFSHWLVVIEKEWLPWLAQHANINADTLNLEKGKSLLVTHGKQISLVMGSITAVLLQSGISIVSFVVQLALVFVVLFYLLRDWPTLMLKAKSTLSANHFGQNLIKIVAKCDQILSVFFRGQLSVMASLGLIYSIGLSLVGVNYGILLGFISGLLSIVPYLGGAVGLTLSLLVGYLQFHDWSSLMLILGVFGIGQALESMVLTPYLIGDKLGLHPVVVIFAIMAGGELFGFFGVLLALPVAAVMVVLVKDCHQTRGNNDVGPTAF